MSYISQGMDYGKRSGGDGIADAGSGFLKTIRAEVKADDEKREKRREERRRFRARLYYILLALLIIGIVAFLVIKRDLIWN